MGQSLILSMPILTNLILDSDSKQSWADYKALNECQERANWKFCNCFIYVLKLLSVKTKTCFGLFNL